MSTHWQSISCLYVSQQPRVMPWSPKFAHSYLFSIPAKTWSQSNSHLFFSEWMNAFIHSFSTMQFTRETSRYFYKEKTVKHTIHNKVWSHTGKSFPCIPCGVSPIVPEMRCHQCGWQCVSHSYSDKTDFPMHTVFGRYLRDPGARPQGMASGNSNINRIFFISQYHT